MRLHVGGLVPEVLEADLEARFKPFGTVSAVDIIRGNGFGDSGCRGFAYVTLDADEGQLARCIKVYNRAKWRGRTLSVEEAKPSYLERLQVCATNP